MSSMRVNSSQTIAPNAALIAASEVIDVTGTIDGTEMIKTGTSDGSELINRCGVRRRIPSRSGHPR